MNDWEKILVENAKSGKMEDLIKLAKYIYNNNSSTIHYSKAYEIFMQFEDLSESKYYLGLMYFNGKGVKRDVKKALKYMNESAKLDNEDAIIFIEDYYYSPKAQKTRLDELERELENVSEDDFEQIKKLSKKYKNTFTKDLSLLSSGYLSGANGNKIDYYKAYKYSKIGYLFKEGMCTYVLALIYHFGYNVEQDIEKAFELYCNACEYGNSSAMLNLGYMYEMGEFVEQDYKAAIKYYEMCRKNGDYGANSFLGEMYECGSGVDVDYRKARDLYVEGMTNGIDICYCSLADMYYNGRGFEQNYELAFELYSDAAESNIAEAFYMLGVMYELGQYVIHDLKKAIHYYKLALEEGYEDAKEKLELLNEKLEIQ